MILVRVRRSIVPVVAIVATGVLLSGCSHEPAADYTRLDRTVKQLALGSIGDVLYLKHSSWSDSFGSRPDVLIVIKGTAAASTAEGRLEATGFTHLGSNQWVMGKVEKAYVDAIADGTTFTARNGKKFDIPGGGASVVIVHN